MTNENKLLLIEKKLQIQYQTLPIPTYIWKKTGEDFILVAYNESAIENTQGDVKNFLRKKAHESFQYMHDFLNDLLKCYNEKVTIIREMSFKYIKRAETRNLKVTYSFVAPCYIIVHTEDVTEHVKTKSRLQETEKRYATIFNQAADTIILIDVETGRFVNFNKKAYENLGYTRQEFRKMKIADFEVNESPKEVEKHIKRITDQGSDIFETKHRAKNGEIHDVQVNVTTIKIHGKMYLHSISRDITRLRQIEEENKKLIIKAEESKMVDQIKEKNILLEEKNVALRQVMEQVKLERKRIEDQIRSNVDELIVPVIDKMRGKCSGLAIKYLDMLEENIKNLTSSFGYTITKNPTKLTARELEVCNMIRNGLSSKEISTLLSNSYKTIEKQRKIIRKKLDITDRAVNLAIFLKNL